MKLKKWMDLNSYSVKDLADELEVDRTSISKYINGTRTPRLELAVKIELFTEGEVMASELLGDSA